MIITRLLITYWAFNFLNIDIDNLCGPPKKFQNKETYGIINLRKVNNWPTTGTILWKRRQGLIKKYRCSGAQLQKYFSHPCLVIYSFATTAPIKQKLGRQISGETSNSKPPGPMIMMGAKKHTEKKSDRIYYTFFSASAPHCCAVYQPPQAYEIMLSQTDMFGLFFIELYCADSRTEHRYRCSDPTIGEAQGFRRFHGLLGLKEVSGFRV
jgi:hypothetical protein